MTMAYWLWRLRRRRASRSVLASPQARQSEMNTNEPTPPQTAPAVARRRRRGTAACWSDMSGPSSHPDTRVYGDARGRRSAR